MSDHRIVILGGGFAGIYTALHLRDLANSDDRFHVHLIANRPNFLFYPFLPQVASGRIRPDNLLEPLTSFLPEDMFTITIDQINEVDMGSRQVLTDGEPILFDTLVVALGSVIDHHGVPGAAEHTISLKSISQARKLYDRILSQTEQAAKLPPQNRKPLLSYVLCGGGLTGVELAAEIADLFKEELFSKHGTVNPKEVSITLIEGAPRILPLLDSDFSASAEKTLRKKGIHVVVDTFVDKIEGELVTAGDETYPAGTIIWAAGIKGAPLPGLPRSTGNRIPVDDTLQVADHPGVFALWDIALIPLPGGNHLPASAQVATQAARCAAFNILQKLRGQQPTPFQYKERGNLVPLGRYFSLAKFSGLKFKGRLGWLFEKVGHLALLPGMRTRFNVLVDWFKRG